MGGIRPRPFCRDLPTASGDTYGSACSTACYQRTCHLLANVGVARELAAGRLRLVVGASSVRVPGQVEASGPGEEREQREQRVRAPRHVSRRPDACDACESHVSRM